MAEVHDEPSKVYAEDGVVLTVEAAEETSDRLLRGAAKAHGQRLSRNR